MTRRSLVPFGLSETDLGPAYIDIADHPHAVAVGAPRSGRSNFLRVMCRSITSLYRPEEAKILVLDPRRARICATTPTPTPLFVKRSRNSLLSLTIGSLLPARRRRR